MKGSTKYYYYLLLIICQLFGFGTASYAQQPDSALAAPAPLQVRLPDPEKLEAMRKDKDFQYFEEAQLDDTFWERLKYKIGKWLHDIFYASKAGRFWEFVIYAFLVATLVFVIAKMQKADLSGLLGKKKTAAAEVPYDVLEENIHELNLDALIEEAVAQHEYRKAVRLHYLRSLKKLTDASLINWKPGKTNRSYIAEIQHPLLKQEFEQLTSMFEYVWYGGAALGAAYFETARQEFVQFDDLLKQHA